MAIEHTIGLITALDTEHKAVLRAFNIDPQSPPVRYIFNYRQVTLKSQSGADLRVVITCAFESGNAEAVSPTSELIQKFEPECVVFVGIACGLQSMKLGDVVTSGVVCAYEYVKTRTILDVVDSEERAQTGESPAATHVRSESVQPSTTETTEVLDRSRFHATPAHLCRDVESFSAESVAKWQRQVHDLLSNRCAINSKLQNGPVLHRSVGIATGNKVMAGGELEGIHRRMDLIRALEMESHGFVSGCTVGRHQIPWLVVRGIADHGDQETKGGSSPKKDVFQEAAAVSAAVFARVFLECAYTPDWYAGAYFLHREPPTPLRKVMASRMITRVHDAVRELTDRRLYGKGAPHMFVEMATKRLSSERAVRVVAFCGGKAWGYDNAIRYYDACFAFAQRRSRWLDHVRRGVDRVRRRSPVPGGAYLVRFFVKPESGFSDWDNHVLAAHARARGTQALVISRTKFESKLDAIAGDVLDVDLGLVAIENEAGEFLGTTWEVMAHAGRHEGFRFAEFRAEYAVREAISLFNMLFYNCDPQVWNPSAEHRSLRWPPPRRVYDQCHD